MRPRLCITTAVMLLFCSIATAGTRYAGLHNSPKGFGLSFCVAADEASFNAYSALADLSGVITGKYSTPGLYFNYSHNSFIRNDVRGDAQCFLYAGPGISAGYLRDRKSDKYGVMIALSGTIGGRFVFKDRIALDLSINTDLGVHFREKDQNGDGIGMYLYRYGLMRVIFPQLKIEYRF